MTLTDRLLARPGVYRAWQAPFERKKLAPFLATGDAVEARRVLDVGCGPGTNARRFTHTDYVGVDASQEYVDDARARRLPGHFLVVDAVTQPLPADEPYDLILVNSLLHHLPDDAARGVLAKVARALAPGGAVHVLDLVLPPRRSVARGLARADRGDYPRPLAAWRALFHEHFEPVVWEPYAIRLLGLPLWRMVYFKGSARV